MVPLLMANPKPTRGMALSVSDQLAYIWAYESDQVPTDCCLTVPSHFPNSPVSSLPGLQLFQGKEAAWAIGAGSSPRFPKCLCLPWAGLLPELDQSRTPTSIAARWGTSIHLVLYTSCDQVGMCSSVLFTLVLPSVHSIAIGALSFIL